MSRDLNRSGCYYRPASIYEIRVRGELEPHWSSWFDGMRIACEGRGECALVGPVADQAALHGLLAKIRDLGLPLISVQMIDDP
jgi:hypothetical protein